MVWKGGWFKYEKLGTKSVPLGYLEFSRTFEGGPCPRSPMPPPSRSPLPSPPASPCPCPVRARAWVRAWFVLDRAAPDSFWTGSFGCGREKTNPESEMGCANVDTKPYPTRCTPHPFLEMGSYLQRTEQNSSDKNCENSCGVSVCQNGCDWTVATAPSNCRSGALNSTPLDSFQHTEQTTETEEKDLNLWVIQTEIFLSPLSFSVNSPLNIDIDSIWVVSWSKFVHFQLVKIPINFGSTVRSI